MPGAAPPPVGQVRLRLENLTSYADLRGAIECNLVVQGEARRGRRCPRTGPAAAGRRSGTGVAPDPPQRPGARRPADGPEGARGGRQRLPGGGALPAPARPAAAGPVAAAWPVGRGLGRPRRAARRGRAHRQDRHRPPASTHRRRWAGSRAATTTGARSTSTGATDSRAWSAARWCAPRCSRDATSSGVRVASRVSARGRVPMSSLVDDGSNSRPSTVPARREARGQSLARATPAVAGPCPPAAVDPDPEEDGLYRRARRCWLSVCRCSC